MPEAQHTVAVPVTLSAEFCVAQGQHVVNVTPKTIEEHLQNQSNVLDVIIDPSKLDWEPATEGMYAGH